MRPLSPAGWCRRLRRRYRRLKSGLSRINLRTHRVCHGQPTVRGLRYPVGNLLELLSSGMTIDDVLQDQPDLERDDVGRSGVRGTYHQRRARSTARVTFPQ